MTIVSFEYKDTIGKTDYFTVNVKSGAFIVTMTAKIDGNSTDVYLIDGVKTVDADTYIRLIEAIKRRWIRECSRFD